MSQPREVCHDLLRNMMEAPSLEMSEAIAENLSAFSSETLLACLAEIVAEDDDLEEGWRSSERWQLLLSRIAKRPLPAESVVDDETRALGGLYSWLKGVSADRHILLARLGKIGTPGSLRVFVRCYIDDPPEGPSAATAPLLSLFALEFPAQMEVVFPDLLAGLSHPDTATGILDVANFLTRHGRVSEHPASQRHRELVSLAEATVAQLDQAQRVDLNQADRKATQAVVAQGVPLAVALCDALGWIGDKRAIPTLERMGELQHRRLRVEAAAALGRLGEESAVESLVTLAEDAVVRLRAVSYAEELGVLDRIDEEFRTPVALAESQLFAFLSQPTQVGTPPARCELVDSRTLAWPGYEEPRDCYLFRFEYPLVDAEAGPTTFSNIGIAGPLAHTFYADLAELPLEDIYAAFAGWQTEHEDIRLQNFSAERANGQIQDLVNRAEGAFSMFTPLAMGEFFGDPFVVGEAQRDETEGVGVVDATNIEWFPATGRLRPIGPPEAFCIYVGRRLLHAFNPNWGTGDVE